MKLLPDAPKRLGISEFRTFSFEVQNLRQLADNWPLFAWQEAPSTWPFVNGRAPLLQLSRVSTES